MCLLDLFPKNTCGWLPRSSAHFGFVFTYLLTFFLYILQYILLYVVYVLTQFSHVRLCNPKDCSSPVSSIHGILQAKILEWVAILSSRASFWPKDWTHVSCHLLHCRWVLYHWATQKPILLIFWLGCFSILSCKSWLYTLDINPLSVISFTNIFSHSVNCFFFLSMVFFAVQKLLSLIRSHLFKFAFISFTLGDRFKKHGY